MKIKLLNNYGIKPKHKLKLLSMKLKLLILENIMMKKNKLNLNYH